jgi:PAS domain S-box-containing protein
VNARERIRHWPLTRLEALIRVASLLCALVVIGATLSHVLQLRRAIHSDADARLQTVSRILAKEVNRSLTHTRLLLEQADEALRETPAEMVAARDGTLNTVLDGLTRQQSLLREIAIVAPSGRIVASSNRRSIGIDVSAHDFAKAIDERRIHVGMATAGRSFAADGTAVQGPGHAKTGFLTLARAVSGREGSIVVAIIGADSLANDLRFMSADEESVFTLYRYDAQTLVTSGEIEATRTRPNPIFRDFLPDRETGSFVDIAEDARRWLVHFDTTADFPVVVEVRLPRSVVIARWEQELVAPAGILLVTILALVLYTRMTAGALRLRARSEQQAATQERRLRNILDTAADGIVTIDGKGIVREYNRAAESIFGVPAATAVGQPMSMLLPSDHADSHQDRVERYLLTGVGSAVGRGRTIRTVRADGRPMELNLAVSEVVDQGEHLFTGIVRDVTEVRQAEERFRTLFQRSGEPHLLFDDTGLIDCNDASMLLLRASGRQALLGRRLEHLAPGMQGAAPSTQVLAEASAEARREGVKRLVWTARALDDTEFPVEMTLTPIRLGNHEAMLVAWHDIAERQRYENDLEQARDAAQSAANAKSQFLAMMSHELRTPMTGIIGMVDLLNDSRLSDEQRHFVGVLRNSAESLLTVVNDVLDYSKIEAGRLDLEQIDFRPDTVVRDVLELLASAASQRGNNLRADWHEGSVPALRGDPTRLRQLLINLVGNAIKFTERGTVAVGLDVHPEDDGRIALHFEVRDTGVGIAPEVLPTLFRPFQQADSSTTRRFGGTGLGLAICRHLVEAMGGEIGVESTPGVGSTFRFSVRLAQALGQPAPRDAGPQAAATTIRSLRVLVAEDNPTNRLLISTRLRRASHRVDLVENGLEAIEAARTEDYDLILMDMQMPELDGAGATRAIRLLPGPRASVPIIALTADALPEFRERYMASGLDDYLTKPIDWRELDRAMLRCVSGRPGAQANDEAPSNGEDPMTPDRPIPTDATFRPAPTGPSEPSARVDAEPVAAMQDDLSEEVWLAVMEVYWPKAEADLAACREAVAAGDPKARREAAHSLKGASASVGFESVATLAAVLEHCDEADAAPGMRRLEAGFALTRASWAGLSEPVVPHD